MLCPAVLCHAVRLLVQKGLMSLDELRRATEALPGVQSTPMQQHQLKQIHLCFTEQQQPQQAQTDDKEDAKQPLGVDWYAALKTVHMALDVLA
jgi:hypothetical protein